MTGCGGDFVGRSRTVGNREEKGKGGEEERLEDP